MYSHRTPQGRVQTLFIIIQLIYFFSEGGKCGESDLTYARATNDTIVVSRVILISMQECCEIRACACERTNL